MNAPLDLLFSTRGRIPLLTWWIITIPLTTVVLIIGIIAFRTHLPALNMLSVPFLYSATCTTAKRLHDRNKTAWCILFSLIPGFGSAWLFIECGCLNSTPGATRFERHYRHHGLKPSNPTTTRRFDDPTWHQTTRKAH